MAEVWVRNPITCIRECAELLFPNICWDRGFARKMRVEPQRHLELHYPSAVNYRILMIGDQGAAELRCGHSMQNPYAVYPVWDFLRDDFRDLESLVFKQSLAPRVHRPEPDETPVEGQEHRVVVANPPRSHSIAGRIFLRALSELQQEHPEVIVHYHGTYSYRVAFGLGFRAADIDPVADASKGRVVLGSGKKIPWEQVVEDIRWAGLLGFATEELSVARNRTMFNIRSAEWASKHWGQDINFKSQGHVEVDPDAPVHHPVEIRSSPFRGKPVSGDKIACDHCSLSSSCKYFRVGGVCSLPDSDGSGLARYFKTRDSDQIIDGLGRLMQKQAERFQRGIEDENDACDGLDPEVTKLGNSIFENGVKLAKLVDPSLAAAGATRIGIQVNAGGAAPQMTPAGLMAGVVRELEAQGIARHEITAEMVADYIAAQNRVAIEANSTQL